MIDVTSEINAIERKVGTRVLPAGEARTVTITRTYNTSIADLWDACTSAARIPRWFLPISGELHVGGRYQLQGNAGGTIERCEPPRTFSATWEFGGGVTWIEVHLTAESDNRTRLELEHIAQVDDAHWLEFGPGAVGVGWDLTASGLGRYLSSGHGLDPREAAAWMASDEARRLMTMSSRAWRDANIAGGTEAGLAHTQAERTTAFYTGVPQPSPAA